MFFVTEGKNVPRDDPQHKLYLNYYKDMGINQDFYWFTLKAAPADGVHWMMPQEMDLFKMSTEAPIEGSTPETADCYRRLSHEAE